MTTATVKFRDPSPGDLGWVVHRHGVLYAQEYGWNLEFEALVATVIGDFVKKFDAAYDRAWIVELDAKVVGSVFITRVAERSAKLRLLYVEPEARGHGIGRKLVDSALKFARSAGYEEVVLWTNPLLTSARKIYEASGFVMMEERTEQAFGGDFVSQTWKKDLRLGN